VKYRPSPRKTGSEQRDDVRRDFAAATKNTGRVPVTDRLQVGCDVRHSVIGTRKADAEMCKKQRG
jgi:hypothetical protein